MRQLAIARPTYVAIATTPSQPISGTGRGGLGTTIIRCTHSKTLRSRSEIELVNCMTGLVSRLASSVVVELGELVVQVGARDAGQGQGVGALGEVPDDDPDGDDRRRRGSSG